MKKEKELYSAPALRQIPLQLETKFCASTVDTGNMGIDFDNPFGDSEYNL